MPSARVASFALSPHCVRFDRVWQVQTEHPMEGLSFQAQRFRRGVRPAAQPTSITDSSQRRVHASPHYLACRRLLRAIPSHTTRALFRHAHACTATQSRTPPACASQLPPFRHAHPSSFPLSLLAGVVRQPAAAPTPPRACSGARAPNRTRATRTPRCNPPPYTKAYQMPSCKRLRSCRLIPYFL